VTPLRAFARPRVWLGLWIFGWILTVVLSLVRPPQLGLDVPDGDKLGHLLAYATLSAWAGMLFAARRAHWLAALALVGLGIAMEFAQGAFTDYRMQDPRDAVANTIGVLVGLSVARAWMQGGLQALDRRWFS
jgi:VanZ family protein